MNSNHGFNQEESVQSPQTEDETTRVRRRSIVSITTDDSISNTEKRRRIHALMNNQEMCDGGEGRDSEEDGGDGLEAGPSEPPFACVHYERNCNIIAPCCNRVFGCRVCHDENSPAGHLPMDRFKIKEVVCRNCNVRQAKSNTCIECHTEFGSYFCGICNLWMSMSKKPFHCSDCGICRTGGASAFRHCQKCSMCIAVAAFDGHKCSPGHYDRNCPICSENLFSSRQAPQDLRCGHAIHGHCFRKLAAYDYRCPVCRKTAVAAQYMSDAWETRARQIEDNPIPAEATRKVDISCIDCESKSEDQQWHFLGVRCPECGSFNTATDRLSNVNTNRTHHDGNLV